MKTLKTHMLEELAQSHEWKRPQMIFSNAKNAVAIAKKQFPITYKKLGE